MPAPAIMIQGVGSNVGKSLLVAGLCRRLKRQGIKVLPFKPQNMSNNAAVTVEGGEIGRAQALQARAAGVPPSIHMNPVLLKPESDHGAQVIVQGKRYKTMSAKDYGSEKEFLLPKVLESFRHLQSQADLVIVEGAGSAAETNLRSGDIANMGFAEAADVPVILVGDIDRGGVIASLVGTKHVLDVEDSNRIKGFIVNKFRGDKALFAKGVEAIEAATGWPGLGVVPWFDGAHLLPAEDSLDLSLKSQKKQNNKDAYHVVVPVLRRLANMDDIDPLLADDAIRLTLVEKGQPLPLDTDMVLLAGSKSTISDLEFLRQEGWDIDIRALLRQGAKVVGLCGGYQMLGKWIEDPLGLEGAAGGVEGLGLLDVTTVLGDEKILRYVDGVEQSTGASVSGYEIHLGETNGGLAPMIRFSDGTSDGAISSCGQVMGCYLHGIFANDDFRARWLSEVGRRSGLGDFTDKTEQVLDDLAKHIDEHIGLQHFA